MKSEIGQSDGNFDVYRVKQFDTDQSSTLSQTGVSPGFERKNVDLTQGKSSENRVSSLPVVCNYNFCSFLSKADNCSTPATATADHSAAAGG